MPSVRDIFPALPATLDAALSRAMAKTPDERFRSVSEFGRAIQQEVSDPRFATMTRPRALSLAVLPLSNLSAEPDTEYFSDGLTKEIIGALSQVRIHLTQRDHRLLLEIVGEITITLRKSFRLARDYRPWSASRSANRASVHRLRRFMQPPVMNDTSTTPGTRDIAAEMDIAGVWGRAKNLDRWASAANCSNMFTCGRGQAETRLDSLSATRSPSR
ncbi:MAG: hypothetical protein ABI877_04690 [Gemmatimonadaceae bacterium]